MNPDNYPYAQLDQDGYELQFFDETAPEVASDTDRFAAKPGDMVKLVFFYKEPLPNQSGYTSERMWVEIMDYGDGCLIGRLDNNPQFTDILHSDYAISFHPKHILKFWSKEF
jgi:hypothetical protein